MTTLYIIEAVAVLALIFAYFIIPMITKNKLLPVNREIIDRENTGVALMTVNGIGDRFVGKFRYDKENDIYATYHMATFLYIPILPMGCFVVKNVSDFTDSKYEVYGLIKSSGWELLQLYLRWYGWILFAVNSFLLLTWFTY